MTGFDWGRGICYDGEKGGGAVLKIVKNMGSFPFSKMMELYSHSNASAARERYPQETEFQGLYRVEMEFYQYLRHDFFAMEDNFYAIWLEAGIPVSAARFERWKDGYLLEALETHPDYRGKGYAVCVLQEALELISLPVYSHVRKENKASLRVHEKCGFVISRDTALVNGNFDSRFVTLRKEKSHG